MASEILGRAPCPECGFQSAHIKIKTDKDGAQPYRHCPDCGSQYFTKNKSQGDALRLKIRAGSETKKEQEPVPAALPADKKPEPTEPQYKVILGVRMPV